MASSTSSSTFAAARALEMGFSRSVMASLSQTPASINSFIAGSPLLGHLCLPLNGLLASAVFQVAPLFMSRSITFKPKIGRPATGRDPLVGVRLPQELIDRLDDWARAQDLTRSAAVRLVIERALKRAARTGRAQCPTPIGMPTPSRITTNSKAYRQSLMNQSQGLRYVL